MISGATPAAFNLVASSMAFSARPFAKPCSVRARYGIIDYETDMLILTLSGFSREHIPELLVLTPAEAGKVRAALRRKLPFDLYWRVFMVNHARY
ncbi:MAG: hypothetical protein MJY77_08425 [Bacteroidaceae bacterium]|nr:hypothetical protein [Bacteroidaceae bacterium]